MPKQATGHGKFGHEKQACWPQICKLPAEGTLITCVRVTLKAKPEIKNSKIAGKPQITYLHQYFKTPAESGTLRSWHIAKALVKKGYSVHIITAWNKPEKSVLEIDGIQVHYLPIRYSNNLVPWDRTLAFLKFALGSTREASSLKSGLCYASSTPLSVGLTALWLKLRYDTPFIFEVRDLWPEAPIELGFLKNKLLQKFSRWLAFVLYKQAKAIVALSAGMEKGILDSAGKEVADKIQVIPNFSDTNFYFGLAESNHKPLANNLFPDLIGSTLIAYTGSLGFSNGVKNC